MVSYATVKKIGFAEFKCDRIRISFEDDRDTQNMRI